jgi:Holliday junction DNA helicase RuvA
MIHYVKGELAFKMDGRVVIEAGGIGYEISVPDNSPVYLKQEGETALIYTVMMVRDDGVSLYGFPDGESLELFQKLLTVSGVGAKAAMALLSAMSATELGRAIVFGDTAMLTRANGVGKKSAERIILELKDKVSAFSDPLSLRTFPNRAPGEISRAEAIEALAGLGYSKAEAASAVASVETNGLSVEDYVKQALKKI